MECRSEEACETCKYEEMCRIIKETLEVMEADIESTKE